MSSAETTPVGLTVEGIDVRVAGSVILGPL